MSETQGQKARRNLRKKLTDIGIGPTRSEVNSRRERQVQVQASAKQGPKPPVKTAPVSKPMGPYEDANTRRARNTTVQPVPPRPTITAKERWAAMGEQSKAQDAAANRQSPAEPLPNNTFTQTDAYSRRRIADTPQSSGIGVGGTGVVGGAFQPRDTELGRRQLGLPSRAEQNARRVRANGPGQSILRQGQTRLNLPAANAERAAANDLRRGYAQAIRRSSREGAVIGDRNAKLFQDQMGNMTSRRNTDVAMATTRRGQDVTARGQDINANVQYRGQDVTARGQDLNYSSTLRGQDVTARGQDLNYDSTTRGQDLNFQTSRRGQDVTMRGQDKSADSYKYATDAGIFNNEQDNEAFRERTAAQSEAAFAGLQSEQDQESFKRAENQITMMSTIDGEVDTQLQARMHGNLQEAAGLPEEYRGITMNTIGDITGLLDQINRQQPKGGKRLTLSDLAATDKDGNPLVSVGTNKMGFFEALLQGHLPGYEELNIGGFGSYDYGKLKGLRSRQAESITRVPTQYKR